MTATDLPTMTHGLTAAERNAFAKAIRLNLAARVQRVAPRRYLVPSTTTSDVYAVWQDAAGTLHCPCVAGSLGHACVHVAGIRLRKTQEEALRQARKIARSKPQPPLSARSSHQSLKRVELL